MTSHIQLEEFSMLNNVPLGHIVVCLQQGPLICWLMRLLLGPKDASLADPKHAWNHGEALALWLLEGLGKQAMVFHEHGVLCHIEEPSIVPSTPGWVLVQYFSNTPQTYMCAHVDGLAQQQLTSQRTRNKKQDALTPYLPNPQHRAFIPMKSQRDNFVLVVGH